MKKKNPFERCFSSPTQHLCTHTEGFRVGTFRLVTHQVDGESGMRHACSDDRSPFKYVSGTFGFAFSFHFPFALLFNMWQESAYLEESKELGSCAGNSHTSQRGSPTRSPGPTLCGCQRVQKATSPVGKKTKNKHNENLWVDLLRCFGTRLLYIHHQFLGIG
jgi:hypothetical protein